MGIVNRAGSEPKALDSRQCLHTLSRKNLEEKKEKKQTTLAPVRQYLQASVVPVLLAGLTELASAQPADPVAWLAQYLIDNNPRNKKDGEGGDDEKMGEEEGGDKGGASK